MLYRFGQVASGHFDSSKPIVSENRARGLLKYRFIEPLALSHLAGRQQQVGEPDLRREVIRPSSHGFLQRRRGCSLLTQRTLDNCPVIHPTKFRRGPTASPPLPGTPT